MTKPRRVGTFTLGILLIIFGILFTLRIFIADLSYHIIFSMWPVIFLLLGIEILLAGIKQTGEKLVYDTTAFFLIIILSFFAMGMAVAEFCIKYAGSYIIM